MIRSSMASIVVDFHRHLPAGYLNVDVSVGAGAGMSADLVADQRRAGMAEFHRYLRAFRVAHVVLHPCFQAGDFADLPGYYARVAEFLADLPPGRRAMVSTFGGVDFTRDPAAILAAVRRHDLAGLKLHPRQGFTVDRATLAPYCEVIQHAGKPVYVHTDWVPSTAYKRRKVTLVHKMRTLARLLPGVPVVLGHAGNSDSYLAIHKVLAKCSNVLVETSMAPTPSELEKAARRFGAHRLLFGSNAPLCAPAKELKTVEVLRVALSEREQVLGRNAARLLGLSDEALHLAYQKTREGAA